MLLTGDSLMRALAEGKGTEVHGTLVREPNSLAFVPALSAAIFVATGSEQERPH